MEAKGRVLLKIMGILMIVSGGLGIVVSIVFAILSAAMAARGGSGTVVIGLLLLIAGYIVEVIAGVVCLRNSSNPQKATACMTWAVITIVINIIGSILVLTGTNVLAAEQGETASVGASAIFSIILGIVIPILALIGAILNFNSGKHPVSDKSSVSKKPELSSAVKELAESEALPESGTEESGAESPESSEEMPESRPEAAEELPESEPEAAEEMPESRPEAEETPESEPEAAEEPLENNTETAEETPESGSEILETDSSEEKTEEDSTEKDHQTGED